MISINENRNGNDLHMEGNKITLMTEASMIIAGLLKSKVINERDLDSMSSKGVKQGRLGRA